MKGNSSRLRYRAMRLMYCRWVSPYAFSKLSGVELSEELLEFHATGAGRDMLTLASRTKLLPCCRRGTILIEHEPRFLCAPVPPPPTKKTRQQSKPIYLIIIEHTYKCVYVVLDDFDTTHTNQHPRLLASPGRCPRGVGSRSGGGTLVVPVRGFNAVSPRDRLSRLATVSNMVAGGGARMGAGGRGDTFVSMDGGGGEETTVSPASCG